MFLLKFTMLFGPPDVDLVDAAAGGRPARAMTPARSPRRPRSSRAGGRPDLPVKIGHRATATTAKILLRTRLGDASAGTHVHCTVRNFLGRGQKSGWLPNHPVDGIFFSLPLT